MHLMLIKKLVIFICSTFFLTSSYAFRRNGVGIHTKLLFNDMISNNSHETQIPFGPPAIVLAGFQSSTSLEIIDDLIEAVLGYVPPVIVIGPNDLNRTTKAILLQGKAQINERDHVLPSSPALLPNPIVLFSGMERNVVSETIRAYKGWNGPESGRLPRCCFAIVVPPAVDKTLIELFSEINDDFMQNEIPS